MLKTTGQDPNDLSKDSDWSRYYNPPVYSMVLAPFAMFEIHRAYGLTLIVNLIGTALLLRVLQRILVDHPAMFIFLAAGLLTSQPFNYSLWHSQPTIYLASTLGLIYLWMESGHFRGAGWLWALLLVKPHWLMAPAITVSPLPMRSARTLAVGFALMMAPFALVGPEGMLDYARLVLGRGQGDLADDSFAEAVLSWPGFFRGLSTDAQPLLALMMITITLVLFLAVRRRADASLLPIAGVATMLIVIPHSHPQDWILLAPGAALLLRSQTSPYEILVSAVLLLGLHFGMEHWTGLLNRAFVFYWPTLAAFCLLVWSLVLSEARHTQDVIAESQTAPDLLPPMVIQDAWLSRTLSGPDR